MSLWLAHCLPRGHFSKTRWRWRRHCGPCLFAHSTTKEPTIYNLSTPPGKGGVAMIRISGSHATEVLERMTQRPMGDFKPRQLHRCDIVECESPTSVIDSGMAVYFPRPDSFTGEDVVELHAHGGPAVIQAVLKSLSSMHQFRPSEPGEFAKRAFYNGKMDLTETEGLADLIHAETETQRLLALNQMKGSLRKTCEKWRRDLIKCQANIEAYIDFGEDENIEEGVVPEVSSMVEHLLGELGHHLDDGHKGEILRSGINVAMVGPPNVGKSSLMNLLMQRKASIVSPVPGTTRDAIQGTVNLSGYQVNFIDTAGIRDCTEDVIEMKGISVSLQQDAHVRVVVFDISSCGDGKDAVTKNIKDLLQADDALISSTLFLLNKVDLMQSQRQRGLVSQFGMALNDTFGRPLDLYPVSVTERQGVGELLHGLSKLIMSKYEGGLCASSQPVITRERHRVHLLDCSSHLRAFQALLNRDIVLAAEELRYAGSALGKITGQISTEDVLDTLFRDFCIGK